MSDRDARVEAALAAIETDEADMDMLRPAMVRALAAADAVQGDEVEQLREELRIARFDAGVARGESDMAVASAVQRSQAADDRRMVDLDAVISVLSGSWGEPLPSDYGIAAAELVEREFGGSAPSEGQP